MTLTEARRALARFTWETDPHSQPRPIAALIGALRIATVVVRDVARGELRLQAMGLVYTSLLALIPLLAVVFAVLKAFGAHGLLKPMLLHFLAPLEDTGVELTRHIVAFVSKMRVGLLGTVGVGLLLYASVSLIRKIEQAFNSIWQVKRGRRWTRRLSDYFAVIVIGPLLFFMAIGVTASLSSSTWLKPLAGFMSIAAKLVPYALVIGAHALAYVFIPNTRVRVRSALVGATVAGILWQSAGFALAAVVAGSGQYRVIYASLALLILFMIWLYVSWLIVLIGASIAYYHQHPERVHRQPDSAAALSIRHRERLGLLVARRIGEHYLTGKAPWSAEQLARQLQQPLAAVEETLAAFSVAGLLVPAQHDPVVYLPRQALETVPLLDVLHAVRVHGLETFVGKDEAVATVLDDIDAALARALAGKTWRDLALAPPLDSSALTRANVALHAASAPRAASTVQLPDESLDPAASSHTP